jgi:hypothetical protein
MKKISILSIMICVICFSKSIIAQSIFQKYLTNVPTVSSAGQRMCINRDNGCTITGSFYVSNANSGIYLVSTDSLGNVKWQNNIQGINLSCNSYDVLQTADNGFIICGSREINESLSIFNILLIRFDSSGNVEWQKVIGDSMVLHSSSIIQTSDGGFILTGDYGFGYYNDIILKTDSVGNIQWSKYFSQQSNALTFIKESPDGGFFITGAALSLTSHSNYDIYLSKINASGIVQWTKFFGGNNEEYPADILVTHDSSIVVVGKTRSFSVLNNQTYLIKTNFSGDLLWSEVFSGDYSTAGNSVDETLDNGYLITGEVTNVSGASTDIHVTKVDSGGQIIWSKSYGDIYNDLGMDGHPLPDSTFLVSGYTINGSSSKVYLLKIGADGTSPCYNAFTQTTIVNVADRDSTGILTISSSPPFQTNLSNAGNGLFRINATTICLSTGINENELHQNTQLFPNPSSGEFTLMSSQDMNNGTIEVFNITGEKILSKSLQLGSDNIINLAGFSDGLYIFKVTDEKNVYILKGIKD